MRVSLALQLPEIRLTVPKGLINLSRQMENVTLPTWGSLEKFLLLVIAKLSRQAMSCFGFLLSRRGARLSPTQDIVHPSL